MKLKTTRVAVKAVASQVSPATPDVIEISNEAWPSGDKLLKEIQITVEGSLVLVNEAVAGTVQKTSNLIKSIEFNTNVHGPIIPASMTGRALEIMLNYLNKSITKRTDVALGAGTKAFRITYSIPMGFQNNQVRPEDSWLDLIRAIPTLRITLGSAADLVSGGTYDSKTYSATVRVTAVVATEVGAGDLPGVMPVYERKQFDLTSTGNLQEFGLTRGESIYESLFVQQIRDAAEVSDILGNVSLLKDGSDYIVRNVDAAQLGEVGADHYEMQKADMPTGVVPLILNHSGKISELLNVLDANSGSLVLVGDITLGAGTVRQLFALRHAFKPIPKDA